MHGLMMNMPLLISSLIRHASEHHSDTEIVSRLTEGGIHRYTYSDAHTRSRQLANALLKLGIKPSDRVGTLAWNGFRHFETYFAVSGMGAVLHTINPRLFPEQIAYIVNHADDQYVFFDITFAPLIDAIAPHCEKVKGWVAMTDRAHLPAMETSGVLCYEELIAASSDQYEWPTLDENTASSLCYTSGTTGNPKGVLYSHRTTILHTYAIALPDVMNLSARDVILPVVPMFHVNAWGTPYACAMVGAKIVFPGAGLDGAEEQDFGAFRKGRMMAHKTEALFRDDAYLSTADATVIAINDRGGIILDRTIFYATSGGQPGDTGYLERADGSRIAIAATITGETKDEIIHVPAPEQAALAVGEKVKLALDWARRYLLMRMHAACHLLTVVCPFPITGAAVSARPTLTKCPGPFHQRQPPRRDGHRH